jgi:hypothetical protein
MSTFRDELAAQLDVVQRDPTKNTEETRAAKVDVIYFMLTSAENDRVLTGNDMAYAQARLLGAQLGYE